MQPSTKAALQALQSALNNPQLSDFELVWAHRHCRLYLEMRSRVITMQQQQRVAR